MFVALRQMDQFISYITLSVDNLIWFWFSYDLEISTSVEILLQD